MQYEQSERASDRAKHIWPEILQAAGVSGDFLTRKNGPCPFCGGKDRYRFANKGDGLWVCTECTSSKWSNGLSFLQRHLGLPDMREAAKWVHKHLDGEPQHAVTREARAATYKEPSPEDLARRVTKMREVWAASRPVQAGDPVDLYLRARVPNLTEVPPGLHYHPGLEYYKPGEKPGERYQLLGKFPAMLVRGFDREGRLVQLHKTYLTADGRKADVPIVKKTDVGVGCNSYALRLMPVEGDVLGVSEGIETGLASSILRNIPVWPCANTSVLANFEVPVHLAERVKRVVIFEDNDAPKQRHDGSKYRPGAEAAAKLAERLRKQRIRTMIVSPAKTGTDFADLAMAA